MRTLQSCGGLTYCIFQACAVIASPVEEQVVEQVDWDGMISFEGYAVVHHIGRSCCSSPLVPHQHASLTVVFNFLPLGSPTVIETSVNGVRIDFVVNSGLQRNPRFTTHMLSIVP